MDENIWCRRNIDYNLLVYNVVARTSSRTVFSGCVIMVRFRRCIKSHLLHRERRRWEPDGCARKLVSSPVMWSQVCFHIFTAPTDWYAGARYYARILRSKNLASPCQWRFYQRPCTYYYYYSIAIAVSTDNARCSSLDPILQISRSRRNKLYIWINDSCLRVDTARCSAIIRNVSRNTFPLTVTTGS